MKKYMPFLLMLLCVTPLKTDPIKVDPASITTNSVPERVVIEERAEEVSETRCIRCSQFLQRLHELLNSLLESEEIPDEALSQFALQQIHEAKCKNAWLYTP